MAESLEDNISKNGDELDDRNNVLTSSKEPLEDGSIPECAVCLQTCVHPCRLPCGHVFCFLCIKGTVATTHPGSVRRCAMCRREIPPDFLDKPVLLCPIFPTAPLDAMQVPQRTMNSELSSVHPSANNQEGYLWFYEGRNGWWQYDERTSLELEASYKRGERSCDLLIAGFLYVADFDGMVQLRRGDPSRRRRIKRDLASIPVKGIAGLRPRHNPPSTPPQPPPPPPLPPPPPPPPSTLGHVVVEHCFFQPQPTTEQRPSVATQPRHTMVPTSAAAAGTPAPDPLSVTDPLGPTGAESVDPHQHHHHPPETLRHVVDGVGNLRLGSGGEVCAREGTGPPRASDSVLWSPVSPEISSASPWVLTLSSDEDQL